MEARSNGSFNRRLIPPQNPNVGSWSSSLSHRPVRCDLKSRVCGLCSHVFVASCMARECALRADYNLPRRAGLLLPVPTPLTLDANAVSLPVSSERSGLGTWVCGSSWIEVGTRDSSQSGEKKKRLRMNCNLSPAVALLSSVSWILNCKWLRQASVKWPLNDPS